MTEQAFFGTWRLVSHKSRTADGRVRYPFGRDAQGYQTYTAEGFPCVAIMGTHRPYFFAANDFTEGTLEEQLAAGKQYLSYAGTYEVREEGVILHHVEVSLFPNSRGRRPGAALYPRRRSAHAVNTAGPHRRPVPHVAPGLPNAQADHALLTRKAGSLHIRRGVVQMTFDLMGFLQEKGLEVVDKQASGGALWVVGGTELAPMMEELKAKGITFSLAPQGGRASRHRPAWFTKWAESTAD